MNNKLREYVDELFADAPPTKKVVEVREEILQNLVDKYNDLLSEGKTPEAAYNIAVANIGDMSELIEELKEDYDMQQDPDYLKEFQASRTRSAAITAGAVALYILSIIPPILLGDTIGPVLMFIFIAIATAMLIFNNMTKPQVPKADDSLAEEFKEWRASTSSKSQTMKAVNSAIWALTVALYILISFWTGAWHITWIIFVLAWAAENFVKAIIDMKN